MSAKSEAVEWYLDDEGLFKELTERLPSFIDLPKGDSAHSRYHYIAEHAVEEAGGSTHIIPFGDCKSSRIRSRSGNFAREIRSMPWFI